MLGFACVDIALLRYSYLGGISSVQMNTNRPIMNMHSDRLNKLFGNCLKEKENKTKHESAINSTIPSTLDEVARPGLFPDYEFDSSVFTPQSGISPDKPPIDIDTPVDLVVSLRRTRDLHIATLRAEADYYSRNGGTCCQAFNYIFTPQSGFVTTYSESSGPQHHKESNMKFRDKESHNVLTVGHGSDSIHTTRDTNDADLNKFFSRPLKVWQDTWSVGDAPLFATFNPWEQYFLDTKVAERVANFKNMRCRMHVKFVINGNSFLYGRIMATYNPLFLQSQDFEEGPLFGVSSIIRSQRPRVFLDPCTSTGGELVLPFFWYKSYFDLFGSEHEEAGMITVEALNVLRHVSGGDGRVTITAFAWCEDMQLSGLTMQPQSGTEIDQANMNGAISRPASNVAAIAGKLTSVPHIGKYAKATQVGASAIASVASHFGYSKPPLTAISSPMTLRAGSSLATTTTPDTCQKLTVDDKQELTIDPTTTGLSSVDEMAIAEIAKKESYLTSFDWLPTDTTEKLLWNTYVQPVAYKVSGSKAFMTACGYAAMPFRYWSGTLHYRFQIVASAFHRGRIRVVYEPTKSESSAAYNTTYQEVVDIADAMDFTIAVTNNQAQDLLTSVKPCDVSNMQGTTALAFRTTGNGVLAVYVVNELTTPLTAEGNEISINVFVSAGDDFQVYVPDETIGGYAFLPQSGQEVDPAAQTSEGFNEAFLKSEDDLAMQSTSDNALSTIYVGENITSFRQLAKRYVLSRREGASGTTFNERWQTIIKGPAYPCLRGDTTSDGRFNTTFVHWVRMPYAAWRGSIRYKVYGHTIDTAAKATIGLIDGGNSRAITSTVLPSNAINDKALQVLYTLANPYPIGASGACVTQLGSLNAAEFEVPFQCPYRFNPVKESNTSAGDPFQRGYRAEFITNGSGQSGLDFWVAGGEDFSTFFWVGPPPFRCVLAGGS
ncbi:hypothetical protein 2 [Shahe picorna-like virus 2]|uniref:hypothetical protein 2 n=1 Tax=Shahe picorna-like virus 2 TaxID=1923445 RepID=UPI0009099DE7|nr:hypothetical protein 2 [Shahe picorna-like virus 2]APG77367.1 hypothetical protein 2 [Shahe picorna-like virus 2]